MTIGMRDERRRVRSKVEFVVEFVLYPREIIRDAVGTGEESRDRFLEEMAV